MKEHTILLIITVILCFSTVHVAFAFTPIASIFPDLDHIHKWDNSNGDTADPFWTKDGNLYTFGCDGRGFGTEFRNINFNKLEGDHIDDLTGSPVNPMSGYGKSEEKKSDGATWKVCGQDCIDGVFYAFVARNVYGDESHDPDVRQTSENASLIKSTDGGRTWVRSAEENYTDPMWPGSRFGAPGFIHYGRNGGNVKADKADEYAYAISNNGFWDCGDYFILGRVSRSKIADLDASDWEYYARNGGATHGMWSTDIRQATPILSLPRKCGWTSPCYIPALRQYLLVSWYVTPALKKWFEPERVFYDFYQAEHPWGPWRYVSSMGDSFLSSGNHMYGPNICAKFQKRIGDKVRVILFTSGCPFQDAPDGLYKLWEIPLLLRVKPSPPSAFINDNDPRIRYSGDWIDSVHRGFGDYDDDVHSTRTPGASAELRFNGTGIDLITERNADHGEMDVYLDGKFKERVNLKLTDFPRMSHVVVFQSHHLKRGNHTIKVVNSGTDYGIIDAFRVYGKSLK